MFAIGEIIEILFSFSVTNTNHCNRLKLMHILAIGVAPGFNGRHHILLKHLQNNLLVNLESKEVDHFSNQSKFIWTLKRIMKQIRLVFVCIVQYASYSALNAEL